MAAPTLVSTTASTNFNSVAGLNKNTPSISWNAGDLIVCWGITGDNGTTLTAPTASGLTFANLLTSNVARAAGAVAVAIRAVVHDRVVAHGGAVVGVDLDPPGAVMSITLSSISAPRSSSEAAIP